MPSQTAGGRNHSEFGCRVKLLPNVELAKPKPDRHVAALTLLGSLGDAAGGLVNPYDLLVANCWTLHKFSLRARSQSCARLLRLTRTVDGEPLTRQWSSCEEPSFDRRAILLSKSDVRECDH